MDNLDDHVTQSGAAAYLMYASSADPDMRYLTRFITQDRVIIFKKPKENVVMVVPQMEAQRAESESRATILTRKQAGYEKIIETIKDPEEITARMAEHLVQGPVLVPASFPVGLARRLESSLPVYVDARSAISEARRIKSSEEIRWIEEVQHATESAMDYAIDLIRRSEVSNGELCIENEPLTSERVKIEIQKFLLEKGCTAEDTIVSCGEETAMPHCTGSGVLKSNQPIVIDIFPRSNKTGYYADMTRTVSKGAPAQAIIEMYQTVKDAVLLGESLVKTGASGADLYQAVRTFFEERGYISGTEGFIHSLGHGVGLEIHEAPTLSPSGVQLQTGEVITIEPGLYYRNTGGVRIENMGVVREGGFERMTSYEMDLIV